MAEQPEQEHRGLTLPGYKYLGPGNSLNRGDPVNKLDSAAKKHDEKYHKITEYYKQTKNRKRFEEEVQKADFEFLEEVKSVAPEGTYDQIAKWVALGGIGAKAALEKYVGVIYPWVSEQDKDGAMEVPGNTSSVIGSGVQNDRHVHKFQFKKKFTFAISSTKAEYSKTKTDVTYTTYIHSIPWQYIFFYLTEKEYEDMTKVFHTAKVTRVGIKITNLGNRTPFLTSTNSVNYANANSQTTIGIWENMELLAPVKLGTTITARTLYGETLNGLSEGSNVNPDHSTAQAKIIDNKIVYGFKLNGVNKSFHLPPLIMEATILFNATNSIGPIFEKDYSPKDGTFHAANEGFETDSYIIRGAPSHVMNVNNESMRNVDYVKKSTKKYSEATVDNLTIGGLYSNAQKDFMGSVGVGIIPLLNKDGSLEDAILNVMVETFIELECISHGTNLLMGKFDKPQPNTLFAGLAIDRYKWKSKYTVAGAPAVETDMATAVDEPMPAYEHPPPEPVATPTPPRSPQPGPSRPSKRRQETTHEEEPTAKQTRKWYDESEKMVIDGRHYQVVRAEKIPGQRKIVKDMSDEQKILTARRNENTRKAAVHQAEQETGNKILLTGKFLNLGIPTGGYYLDTSEHREQIISVGKPNKPPPTKPREPPKIEDHGWKLITVPPTEPIIRPPKAPTPTPPTPTHTPEPKGHLWLVISFKWVHFRIILTEGHMESPSTAEGMIHVDRLPRRDAEPVNITAGSNTELWTKIQETLPGMPDEKYRELYNKILKSYDDERHNRLLE